jgi:glycine hydroxymethyltransferase
MDNEQVDSELYHLIEKEEKRQKKSLNLIASENYASPATLMAQASVFANKLAEGYVGNRYCAGCEVIDELENLAINRLKTLFKVDHANVQCPTATQANLAVYFALLNPGDVVLAPKLSHGGHFSHGSSRHISGRIFKFFHYGVARETERLDFDEIKQLAREQKPKLIIAGMSAYPRKFYYDEYRKIADEAGAFLLADIAHIVGLIIADIHPSPVPYADVITTSTHKTFGGPRGGGLIMCKKALAKKVDEAVFPGTQGAPIMNIIASRASLFKHAMTSVFRQKQNQTIENAKALADSLKSNGLRLVTGGTDTHLILLDLRPQNITGNQAENLLYSVGIVTNKNRIPFDEKPTTETSGLRLGSVPLTNRGMKQREMKKIGEMISRMLLNSNGQSVAAQVKKEVSTITEKFPQLFMDT